jgi:hypothetical protein
MLSDPETSESKVFRRIGILMGLRLGYATSSRSRKDGLEELGRNGTKKDRPLFLNGQGPYEHVLFL